jgi:HEAT repeat protein
VGALEALAALKSPEALDLMKRYTAWGHHHSLRMAAVRGLAALGAGRSDVQSHLVRMLEDRYLLVQLAVVRALGQVGDERAIPALKKIAQGPWDSRLKRTAEETVNRLKKGIEDDKA